MEDEHGGEVRDRAIQGVNEGEGQAGCAVCDRDSKRGREREEVCDWEQWVRSRRSEWVRARASM